MALFAQKPHWQYGMMSAVGNPNTPSLRVSASMKLNMTRCIQEHSSDADVPSQEHDMDEKEVVRDTVLLHCHGVHGTP